MFSEKCLIMDCHGPHLAAYSFSIQFRWGIPFSFGDIYLWEQVAFVIFCVSFRMSTFLFVTLSSPQTLEAHLSDSLIPKQMFLISSCLILIGFLRRVLHKLVDIYGHCCWHCKKGNFFLFLNLFLWIMFLYFFLNLVSAGCLAFMSFQIVIKLWLSRHLTWQMLVLNTLPLSSA